MEYIPKILIVDDEPSICLCFKELFEQEGYKTQTAGSGMKGVEHMNNEHYDVVFLDVFLPDVDGYRLLEYIKKNSPDTMVIIITGYASIESCSNAFRKGAYDFLRKPISNTEILKALENAIGHKKLMIENRYARTALSLSEKKYRILFEKTPVGMALINTKALIIDANTLMGDMVGYTLEEMKKMTFDRICKDTDLCRKWIVSLDEQEGACLQNRSIDLKHKNGHMISVLINMDLVEMDGKQVILTSVRDVSDTR
ncbi:response regulator [Desulfobacterales bacterium HSG16]|nr:response regulator [Desulfobacterales bacterium HSG16]